MVPYGREPAKPKPLMGGHACSRRVTYGRMSNVRVILVQDVLSMVACPFEIILLAFMLDSSLLFLVVSNTGGV